MLAHSSSCKLQASSYKLQAATCNPAVAGSPLRSDLQLSQLPKIILFSTFVVSIFLLILLLRFLR